MKVSVHEYVSQLGSIWIYNIILFTLVNMARSSTLQFISSQAYQLLQVYIIDQTLYIYLICHCTMFLRLAIVCAVLGSVHSAMILSADETGYKVSDTAQLNFYSYVDKRESGQIVRATS